MTLSADEQIKAIQDIIGQALHPAKAWSEQASWPLLGLMAYEEKRPKFVLAETGSHVIGLNLANLDIDDDKWDQVLKVIDPALLRALNLSDNKLTRFTTEGLPRLETLNLNGNGALTAFSFPAGGLKSLVRAELNECAFAELVVPVGMSALQALNVRFGKLARLVFGGDCPVLGVLDVRDNQLRELALPEGFGRLGYLNVERNGLESIRFGGKMAALHSLYLKENKLTALPEGLLDMEALEALYVYGNAFEGALVDILPDSKEKNAWKAVKGYLEGLRDFDEKPLYEAKMILVGNGKVGKTSIRRKLLDPDAPATEASDRTPLLEIDPYPVNLDIVNKKGQSQNIDFQLNIWDFGGQGRYREVQQLFCSRKSLYLFVTSPDDKPENDEYIDYPYWLSMVNAYSLDGDRHSPVIHVVNKIDLPKAKDIDRARIRNQFPNISAFAEVSALKYLNFKDLEQKIRGALGDVSSDVFNNGYPSNWLAVKDKLEELVDEKHISLTYYVDKIAKPLKLREDQAISWLETMDRIGTVIYFGDHEKLKDWIILNPIWAKDAIVKVLDSKLAKRGKLSEEALETIWESAYTDEERLKLIELMKAYRLCYEQADEVNGGVEYVLPSLLPDEPLQYPTWLESMPKMCFKLHYDKFFPAGTINKFMVMLKTGEVVPQEHLAAESTKYWINDKLRVLENKYMWKNNILVEDSRHNAVAHIREDWKESFVEIHLYGEMVKTLFDTVLTQFQKINQELKDTKKLKELPMTILVLSNEMWMDYNHLLKVGVDIFSNRQHTDKTAHNMEQVPNLIGQNKLQEAINVLKQHTKTSEQASELVQFERQLNDSNRNNRLGIIGFSEHQKALNQISDGLLSFYRLLAEDNTQGGNTGQTTHQPRPENVAVTPFPANSAVSGTEVLQPSAGTAKTGKSKIFISYSHKNEQHKNEIENILNTLKEQDWVETWNDRNIEAGEWDPQIKGAMETTDIFIFVITNAFINSDYISKTEITTAYQRYLDKKSIIVPLVFEVCPWELKPVSKNHPKEWHKQEEEWLFPWMSKFLAFPTDGKAVETWTIRNEALMNIFDALKKEIKKLRKNN